MEISSYQNLHNMYKITKKIYDYLLPVYGLPELGKLYCKIEKGGVETYYFVGDYIEFQDAMNRCKYI